MAACARFTPQAAVVLIVAIMQEKAPRVFELIDGKLEELLGGWKR